MTNIAVFASGSGTNLQAIIDAVRRGDLEAEIKLLVCDRPGAYCITRAKQAQIPQLVFSPREFASKGQYEKMILQQITSFRD